MELILLIVGPIIDHQKKRFSPIQNPLGPQKTTNQPLGVYQTRLQEPF